MKAGNIAYYKMNIFMLFYKTPTYSNIFHSH